VKQTQMHRQKWYKPKLNKIVLDISSYLANINIQIKDLLDAGYDTFAQDDKGQNALHIACLYRRFDLAKELISYVKFCIQCSLWTRSKLIA